MLRIWLISALVILPCACLHDGAGPQERVWLGVVRNGCGPADGAQLDVYIDSLAMGCGETRTGAIHMAGRGLTIDSLGAGETYVSTRIAACPDKCVPVEEETRVDVIRLDSDSVTVEFRSIRKPEGGHPDTTEGTARLKLCREAPKPFCG